jgi:hypothetical protein
VKKIVLLTFLIFLTGCAHLPQPVTLKLQPTLSHVRGYQLNISEVSNDPKWQETNKRLDSIRSKFDKISSESNGLKQNDYLGIANELKQITLPQQWPYIATIKDKNNTTLQVKVIGAPAPEVAIEPETEEQRLALKYQKLLEGSIMLLADINSTGTLKSYYLNQKQRNMVSILFGLPNKAVSLSESWHPNINFIELGNGYIVDQPKHINNAQIINLEPQDDGDVLAHIVYVVYEGLDGKYELKPGPDEPSFPFTLKASYLAYGVFSVKYGYWLRYTGVVNFDGSGQIPVHSTKLHALKPITE